MRVARAKIVTSIGPIVPDVINASGLARQGIPETFSPSLSLSFDRFNGKPMKYLVIQGNFLAHVSVKRMGTAEPEDDLWGK